MSRDLYDSEERILERVKVMNLKQLEQLRESSEILTNIEFKWLLDICITSREIYLAKLN